MASLIERSPAEPNPALGCVLDVLDARSHRASLRIQGSLDALTAAEHGRQLGALVDQGFIQLRISLDDLRLCTSDGLDLWDDLQHRLDPLEGRLVLAGATGVVRRVLDVVTRPDAHFCPTIERDAA